MITAGLLGVEEWGTGVTVGGKWKGAVGISCSGGYEEAGRVGWYGVVTLPKIPPPPTTTTTPCQHW